MVYLLVARLESPKWLIGGFAKINSSGGLYKGCLPLSESRWGGDSTRRCWGHLTTILRNQTCLNFLN